MTHLDIARQYLDAWNTHDADAIVRTFAADGTYCDPTTAELSGDAIGANAKRLWSAFPDLAFEIASVAEAGVGRVVAEWIMKGTNTGAFQGLPATGRPISLPGVDVIEIGADGIKAVTELSSHRAIPDLGVAGAHTAVQRWSVCLWQFDCGAVGQEDETWRVWHHDDLERRCADRGQSRSYSGDGN
jgi:steroid delta-isomerase-like uncharacterized protein